MHSDSETRRVATDMERVFRPIAGRRPTPHGATDGTDRAGHAMGRRWAMIAAVIVAMVAAVLAVGYRWGTVPPTMVAATPASRADAAKVERTPVLASPAIAPAAPVDDIVQETPPLSQAIAPPSVVPPSPVPAGDRPVQQRRPPARLLTPAVERTDRRYGITECRPGSLDDRCIYQDVLNADARLDRAYDRASRAGVSPDRLAAINDRWTRARDDENPDRMIRRYEALIDVLDAERREIGR